MLRLTKNDLKDLARISVEGSLTRDTLPLLEEECRAALDAGCRVELDISAVTYIDVKAAAVLRRLQRQGLIVAECPLFLREYVEKLPRGRKQS